MKTQTPRETQRWEPGAREPRSASPARAQTRPQGTSPATTLTLDLCPPEPGEIDPCRAKLPGVGYLDSATPPMGVSPTLPRVPWLWAPGPLPGSGVRVVCGLPGTISSSQRLAQPPRGRNSPANDEA